MFHVEKAGIDDIDALGVLYFQLCAKESVASRMKEVFLRMNADENYHLLVAKEDDQVVGTAMGILCHDLVGLCDPFMLIENVVTLEAFRGQGVGAMIMQALETIARQKRCSYIILVSGSARVGAHAFYDSLGYSATRAKGFKKELVYPTALPPR